MSSHETPCCILEVTNMLTPALRAKKYGELSHEEYALWYASQIGVTEEHTLHEKVRRIFLH